MTESNPGDLHDTTDHPTLTSPGSKDRYFASIAENDIKKQGLQVSDFVFSIMGITYKDGCLVPCFIKEEKFDENSIRAYHGDLESFMARLNSYCWLIDDSINQSRHIVGVYHVAKRVESDRDLVSMEWDEIKFGPKTVPGFI